MGQPVVHFEIGGKNGKKLQAFYASQFGWKIDANNPMQYGVVDTKARGKSRGINGGVFKTPPGAPPQLVTVYIEVAQIDSVLKKIEKSGGKTVMPRTELPGMVTMAQFTDPAGNLMGLVETKIPPAVNPKAREAVKPVLPARKRKAAEKKSNNTVNTRAPAKKKVKRSRAGARI